MVPTSWLWHGELIRSSHWSSKHPGRILAVSADVTKDDQVRDVIDRTVEWRGAIDIVVNNAGITSIQPAEDEDAETFSKVIDVNLIALYRLCHLAGRRMLEQGQGTIINIASINGLVASWSIPEAGYCASKGAVISLTRELAAQWADRGIRVNALAPGYLSKRADGRTVHQQRRRTPVPPYADAARRT